MKESKDRTYTSFSQMQKDLKGRILMVIKSRIHIKVTQQAIKEVFRIHKGISIEAEVYDSIIFIIKLEL